MSEQIVKLFRYEHSQAVKLPKEFCFEGTEVYIRKQGEEVILSPKSTSWDDYFAQARQAPADFLVAKRGL
jgi:antitoxin VapB